LITHAETNPEGKGVKVGKISVGIGVLEGTNVVSGYVGDAGKGVNVGG
jgi:hypothetical protein